MRSPALLALALAVLAAGCFGPDASPVELTPYLELHDAAPGRATEFAFYVQSTSTFRQSLDVSARRLPAGWTFEPENATLDIAGRASTSLVVRVTPNASATYGVHRFDVALGDTTREVLVNVMDLGVERLRAGIGAQLRYVGWYDNGTLFGTNEPSVRARGIPSWPPGGGDPNETEDSTPLKVYVGGKRGEDPPEPYNGTGYRPVIAGFDARLRDAGDGNGMVEGDTLAVRIPKEEAYTTPGNEDHVLYGENLNFLIRIVSVDVLHARECTLPMCPDVPPPGVP